MKIDTDEIREYIAKHRDEIISASGEYHLIVSMLQLMSVLIIVVPFKIKIFKNLITIIKNVFKRNNKPSYHPNLRTC